MAKARPDTGTSRSSRYYKRVRHLAVIASAAILLLTGLETVAAPLRIQPTALPFALAWSRDYQGTPPVTAAVSAGGWLIAGFSDRVEFVSLSTGQPAGSLPLPAPHLGCDAASCIMADDTTVRSVDLAKRSVRWQKPTTGRLAFAPTLRSGWVFLSVNDGTTASKIVALRDTDGGNVWTYSSTTRLTGPIAVDGDRMAIATADWSITMLDLRTGKTLWTTPIFSGLPGAPRLGGGVVYVGTEKRELLFLNATDGKITDTHHPGSVVVGAPALDEHLIYTGGQDGVLNAFDRGTGAVKWRANLPTRPADLGPVTGANLVMIALRNGAVQAYLADGDGKKAAATLAAPGPGDNTIQLRVAPMIAGSGPATRIVTISVAVGDSSKWSATVIAGGATLPATNVPPALIPGLALKLSPAVLVPTPPK